ncbi:type II toxin-antitoxin system VapB family antitoxin [Nocardia sp. NPDC046473]|uniref:type II toxin-antitoxin system VapB family antitoxin n=1 Tax=Nocardia sp. NPDC046473 TaxID=3155733 RepID=UPI0033C4260E
MRTTLDLDDALLRAAKQRAARDGRTLTSLIEEALRMLLEELSERDTVRRDIALPSFGGDGVQVGVDLASWKTVRDADYEDDDARLRSTLTDAAT